MNTHEHTKLSDEELIARFLRDRNNDWLGILLPRYSLLLFGVCMKYLKNEEDAKDTVQQIFLKIISELHRYNIQHFKSWIYMVTKNACLMRLRGQKNFTLEWYDNVPIRDDDAETRQRLIEKEAMLDRLEENISRLKPEQQSCINYFYLEKKSYADIATLTGYSILQVKSHLQNGKRNLEIMMNHRENQKKPDGR